MREERMRANIHARRAGICSDVYRIVGVGEVREERFAQRWMPQLYRSVCRGERLGVLRHSLLGVGVKEGDLEERKSFHHRIRFLPNPSVGLRCGEES